MICKIRIILKGVLYKNVTRDLCTSAVKLVLLLEVLAYYPKYPLYI
jgi:hypothetical protein